MYKGICVYLLFLLSFALLSQLVAIPKIGQSYTALFLYLEPVVGVLGAVFLLNETLVKMFSINKIKKFLSESL